MPASLTALVAASASSTVVPATKRLDRRRPTGERSANARNQRLLERPMNSALSTSAPLAHERIQEYWGNLPQGLKPTFCAALYGTTEVVPLRTKCVVPVQTAPQRGIASQASPQIAQVGIALPQPAGGSYIRIGQRGRFGCLAVFFGLLWISRAGNRGGYRRMRNCK